MSEIGERFVYFAKVIVSEDFCLFLFLFAAVFIEAFLTHSRCQNDRCCAFPPHFGPICVSKELMRFNIRNLNTAVRITNQYQFNKITSTRTNILRQLYLLRYYLMKDLPRRVTGLLVLKRRKAAHHLTHQYANRPHIALIIIALSQHHLGRRVSRCSAVG